ncbi:MAG: response regulator [Verrucomicrobiota bacterium]
MPPTILVVEDEPAVLDLVKAILRRHGFQVLCAADAQGAMDHWSDHAAVIDLLLTDVMLSDGISGLTLGRRLREEKPGLRVLFTSGYNAEAMDWVREFHRGDAFLRKPYELDALVGTVRRLLAPL